MRTAPSDSGVHSGTQFLSAASGRWAGEQFLRALERNEPMTAALLRSCDTLRRDEWIHFDEALVEEGTIRLRGVADLLAAGLTEPIPNALGKTIIEFEKVTDMEPATVSLDGLSRSNLDRQEFERAQVPLPITHKDFNIGIRTLAASRTRGESLDTTQTRTAGRLTTEALERMLFRGHPNGYVGAPIYGYTTHPDRNTSAFGTGGSWSAPGKTGEQIVADILAALDVLSSDDVRMGAGPYWIYVPGNVSTKLEDDFKANSDRTIRDRILAIDQVSAIRVVDQLPPDNVIILQATSDVVTWGQGEDLQTVQWDLYGGFAIAFKAFAIQVPIVKSDADGRSGIFHYSA